MMLASVTPLFLWIEHRKMALIQLPLLIGMWGFFIVEFAAFQVTGVTYAFLLSVFILNVAYAHVALYLVLFHNQLVRKRMSAVQSVVITKNNQNQSI